MRSAWLRSFEHDIKLKQPIFTPGANSWKPNPHRSEPLPEERGEVQSRYQNYDQSNIAKRAEAEAAWKAWVARKEEDAKSRRSSQPVKKEAELSERELMKKRANEATTKGSAVFRAWLVAKSKQEKEETLRRKETEHKLASELDSYYKGRRSSSNKIEPLQSKLLATTVTNQEHPSQGEGSGGVGGGKQQGGNKKREKRTQTIKHEKLKLSPLIQALPRPSSLRVKSVVTDARDGGNSRPQSSPGKSPSKSSQHSQRPSTSPYVSSSKEDGSAATSNKGRDNDDVLYYSDDENQRQRNELIKAKIKSSRGLPLNKRERKILRLYCNPQSSTRQSKKDSIGPHKPTSLSKAKQYYEYSSDESSGDEELYGVKVLDQLRDSVIRNQGLDQKSVPIGDSAMKKFQETKESDSNWVSIELNNASEDAGSTFFTQPRGSEEEADTAAYADDIHNDFESDKDGSDFEKDEEAESSPKAIKDASRRSVDAYKAVSSGDAVAVEETIKGPKDASRRSVDAYKAVSNQVSDDAVDESSPKAIKDASRRSVDAYKAVSHADLSLSPKSIVGDLSPSSPIPDPLTPVSAASPVGAEDYGNDDFEDAKSPSSPKSPQLSAAMSPSGNDYHDEGFEADTKSPAKDEDHFEDE